jgi:hypothetical protein
MLGHAARGDGLALYRNRLRRFSASALLLIEIKFFARSKKKRPEGRF